MSEHFSNKAPIAIQMTEYGPPHVLKPVRAKIPQIYDEDEVVIEVIASAVNRADCEIRSGNWKIKPPNPFPYTPGLETCGRIVDAGRKVSLKSGLPVITMMQKLGGIHGVRPGGYQSFVKVPQGTLALFPTSIDPKDMAAIGLAGVTALNGISKLKIKENERVLIMGASGGVGSMAVMIAKAKGAHVIALTNSSKKVKDLKKFGADEVWDLSKNEWAHYASNKVDAVLEMVGGTTFGQCVGLLKPGGRLCSLGALKGGDATFSIWDLLHELTLSGWSSEDMTQPDLQSSIQELCLLLFRGQIKPPPARFYNLKDAAKAHEDMESGKFAARLLLVPEGK